MTLVYAVLVPATIYGLSIVIPYLPIFGYKHVGDVDSTMKNFAGEFVDTKAGKAADKRREHYTKTTETFYNLITDFYEYGWGHSFHFAPRYEGEDFHASIRRYEHYVASQLGIKTPWNANSTDPKKMPRVLDVGCGIGGPMRAVAKFFKYRVRITGVNITQEHINRAKRYNAREGVKNCDFIRADFNKIPVEDETFDAIYDFEATLHSTDTTKTFKELYRVLKPGGRIVTAQYTLLDAYDEKNAYHRDIIERVDNTNGCYCKGRTTAKTTAALKKAGFNVLSYEDVFSKEAGSDIKFSEVFEGMRGSRFTGTKLGLWCTYIFCYVGETLKILPTGTAAVQKMLMGAAESFKESGREKILTPGMLYVLEKPM
jgi:sterol 24-C-methyltransferase